ncbi:MAG: translation initiation factor IF-6 [Candidatus Bathyarchaeia archaeon]
MTIHRFEILGSPNLGIYALATDTYALVPTGVSEGKLAKIRKVLGVDVCQIDVGESKLNGVLAAGNTHGIALPYYSSEEEVRLLKRELRDINVERLAGKKTALGNLILLNDKGAVVDPSFQPSEMRALADIFDVEVHPAEIAHLPYVGSFAAATNRGALLHPHAEEEEKALITEVLKVPVDVGTVNGGVPYVASGILVNVRGALVGSTTTGPEILIISNIFEV